MLYNTNYYLFHYLTLSFYQYQIVLKSLTEFNYFEATFLERIKDKDYLIILNRVINLFGSNKNNFCFILSMNFLGSFLF